MLGQTLGLLLALFLAAWPAAAHAAEPVTIGYQLIYNPWKVAIAEGAFEAATGREIRWRRFDSGAKEVKAIVRTVGGKPEDVPQVLALYLSLGSPDALVRARADPVER